ncbi:MAG: hypothetical protein H0Z29_07425 [Candidatus Marinimicrobia bacterium]|nr:hypothetical protein [Candidatus Neomarinimicrobiota bacterium]
MKLSHINYYDLLSSKLKIPLDTVIIQAIPVTGGFEQIFSLPNINVYKLKPKNLLFCVEVNEPQVQSGIIRNVVQMGVKRLVLIGSGNIVDSSDNTEIVLVEDHINLSGTNPLIGINSDKTGIVFPDISNLYDISCLKALKSYLSSEVILNKGIALIPKNINMLTEIEKKAKEVFPVIAYTKDIFPYAVLARYTGLKKVIGTILARSLNNLEYTLYNLIKFFIKESD